MYTRIQKKRGFYVSITNEICCLFTKCIGLGQMGVKIWTVVVGCWLSGKNRGVLFTCTLLCSYESSKCF